MRVKQKAAHSFFSVRSRIIPFFSSLENSGINLACIRSFLLNEMSVQLSHFHKYFSKGATQALNMNHDLFS